MRTLIIGHGSIGQSHARILSDLGCDVAFVTSQVINNFPFFPSVESAFLQNYFDYVVIANPTYLHRISLEHLMRLNYQGIVLVEKPLYAQQERGLHIPVGCRILVAYNLRFSELLRETRKLLAQERMISFSAYLGRYLPTRREGVDYRTLYSSKKELGGGALRDLSHELDFSLWLCGPCSEVTAIGGHYSELEMDADDIYAIMMRCEACPIVTIHLDYLNRVTRRDISIQTTKHTINIDFITGYLKMDDEVKYHAPQDAELALVREHQAIIAGDLSQFCSYDDGVRVMDLMDAIERASHSKTWVFLP